MSLQCCWEGACESMAWSDVLIVFSLHIHWQTLTCGSREGWERVAHLGARASPELIIQKKSLRYGGRFLTL